MTILLIILGVGFLIGLGVGIGVHEVNTRWRERWITVQRQEIRELRRELDRTR